MLNWKSYLAAIAASFLAMTVNAQEAAVPRLSLVDDPAAEARDLFFPTSDYWLGVHLVRPSPALREEMKLPKDLGLLVENVQPKSPAEKAGLKDDDVLLKANEKPLGDFRDLVKVINGVKEGKLTLELLRGGKHETAVASLVRRPAEQMPAALPPEAREWLKRFAAEMKEGQPLRFHLLGPGQIVPQGVAGPAPDIATIKVEVRLADGSQIEIARSGDHPANVIATRGKERWEATSDDLSKLPETLRPAVERLLQAPADHVHLFVSPGGPAHGNVIFFGGDARPNETAATAASDTNTEKRIADMQKEIADLRQQVKALQSKSKKE